MEVLSFFSKGIASNTFLLAHGSDAIIIDASVHDPIVDICVQRNLNIHAILLTHGHFDHTLELTRLHNTFNAPIYIHQNDQIMLDDGYLSAYNIFFKSFNYERPNADYYITDNCKLTFGTIVLNAICLPGHTSGSTVYHIDDIMFTGDTLFANSIGRSDLPGGSDIQMKNSLNYFLTYPSNCKVYSGHGANSDLEYIKQNNYYLRNL